MIAKSFVCVILCQIHFRGDLTKYYWPSTVERLAQTWARFFRWRGVATVGWGGRVYTLLSTPKNFACGEQKKKGRRFLRKVFYYVEKIAIPRTSFY
jgi:hypothetical protein